jgi:Zn-dependent protease
MPDPFYEPQQQQQPLPTSQPPRPDTLGQRLKRLFAPVLVALAAAWKWILVGLKFGLPLLKMGGFMLLSFWLYAMAFGWQFAAGVIILIFIHEMGHVIAARIVGLKVSLPLFIPFLGARILMKEMPRNAWIEAIVGIGGPLLGSLGALGTLGCYYLTSNPLFLVIAYFGFFINLFNLVPIIPLDGGRIVSAISPWLWVVGLLIIVPYLIFRVMTYGLVGSVASIFILFIVVMSLPRVIALFRNRSEAQRRYFECTPTQRCVMALLYFSLIASLYMGMEFIKNLLPPGAF